MQESIKYRLLKLYEYTYTLSSLYFFQVNIQILLKVQQENTRTKNILKKLGPRSLTQVSIYRKLKTHTQ